MVNCICCPECPSMRNFKSLNIDCQTQQFLPLLCIHSKTVSFLVKDWDLIWNIVIEDGDASNEVLCNQEIVALTLHEKEHRNEGFFLAATLFSNKMYILYTVHGHKKAKCANMLWSQLSPVKLCSLQKV